MAEPRWQPDYDHSKREWPLLCSPGCGGEVSEPAYVPCVDCGRAKVRHVWCPACEVEIRDPMHFCTPGAARAYLNLP